MSFKKHKPTYTWYLLLIPICLYFSCQQKPAKVKPSFKQVANIKYTEVRRSFITGLSFNEQGYQLEPAWKLSFLPDDSANIFSPERQRFFNFPITFDHDSIVNMARTWLRVKKVTKDSLVFQILKVEAEIIYLEQSKLYMTFYADNYIKNVLHTDVETLKHPLRRDTLFIAARAKQVNSNPDSSFAAREPALFKSKSPMVHVEKVKPAVEAININNIDVADEYLYPEYNITIHKAYKDFYYSFSVLVDDKGTMRFGKSMVYLFPEFKESTIRMMKGIMEGYLKLYVNVIPGKTLGIPHNSSVILNIEGKKD